MATIPVRPFTIRVGVFILVPSFRTLLDNLLYDHLGENHQGLPQILPNKRGLMGLAKQNRVASLCRNEESLLDGHWVYSIVIRGGTADYSTR